VPASVSHAQAAAVRLKGLTVAYLVRRLPRIAAGQRVQLPAAAGGVGLLACQWLRHPGARVIGSVGAAEKAELARAHGCAEPLVRNADVDLAAQVRELTAGEGVSVVYDSVGRDTFAASLRSLRRRGLLVSFGNASGPPDPLDVLSLSRHGSLFLTRPTLGDYVADRRELLASAETVLDLVARGVLQARIGQRVALSEVRRAHLDLEGRRTTGSTILLPD
jgi:NADPH2:quinone reductase